MQGTMRLQEWIHRMEVGGGTKYMRGLLVVFGFIAVAALYDSLCFRHFANAEAMDAAQLARNIAQGKGYTTFCVRPFSMKLTREHRTDKSTLLKEGHRDISNAPVYPLILAPLMWAAPAPGDLTAVKGGFSVYLPEMLIAFLNQLLFGFGALLLFRLALGWFDQTVAWTSSILFVLTELYWRFSVSGLSTMLLIDLVLLLVWLLSRFERGHRENAQTGRLFACAAAVGAVTGLAMLTRYSLGWLIIPVMVFTAWCSSRRRIAFTATVFVAFAIVAVPWLVRTTALSGWPFGTATFAVIEETRLFPADTLQRSLAPAFTGLPGHRWQLVAGVVEKVVTNTREIITAELPRLGGTWLSAFFLVGLFVRFQNVNLNRLRWFVVGALVVMIPVQALTRTHLSTEVPQVNSENLLVLFSPLALVFGVGLFFVLFESWSLPTPALRYAVIAGFALLISLPLLLAFVPPRPPPVSAPYLPPRVQQVAYYLNEREMLMSDVPWAVGWYGERQSVWLTRNWRTEFFEISDYQKVVNGLYISTRTTDRKFLSSWFAGENQGWGTFMLQTFAAREVPSGFPLKHSPEGLFANGELLLMDRDRWSAPRSARNL
jgi:4-amino-4-deoxy-L-arabinose transferase-like glycosyltransferase